MEGEQYDLPAIREKSLLTGVEMMGLESKPGCLVRPFPIGAGMPTSLGELRVSACGTAAQTEGVTYPQCMHGQSQ